MAREMRAGCESINDSANGRRFSARRTDNSSAAKAPAKLTGRTVGPAPEWRFGARERAESRINAYSDHAVEFCFKTRTG
jgi:hypothetical protein